MGDTQDIRWAKRAQRQTRYDRIERSHPAQELFGAAGVAAHDAHVWEAVAEVANESWRLFKHDQTLRRYALSNERFGNRTGSPTEFQNRTGAGEIEIARHAFGQASRTRTDCAYGPRIFNELSQKGKKIRAKRRCGHWANQRQDCRLPHFTVSSHQRISMKVASKLSVTHSNRLALQA